MMKVIQFVLDEAGATAIEYGLLAALISFAIVAAVTMVGSEVNNDFNSVVESF